MAILTDIRAKEQSIGDRIGAAFERFKLNYQRREVYRVTYNELSNLSDRDLNDLGIARGDIHAIAKKGAESV